MVYMMAFFICKMLNCLVLTAHKSVNCEKLWPKRRGMVMFWWGNDRLVCRTFEE